MRRDVRVCVVQTRRKGIQNYNDSKSKHDKIKSRTIVYISSSSSTLVVYFLWK